MQSRYLQVIFTYIAFMLAATLLAFIRRWVRPNGAPSDVWKKYPIYIILNLAFLASIWLPHSWHTLAILLAVIGGCASWELSRALGLSAPERIGLPPATAGLVLFAEWLEPASFVRLWLIILLGGIVLGVLASRHENTGRRAAGLAACLGYLPGCLASFLWIWKTDAGNFAAIFLYGVIAANDALAQITGQLVGRRTLAASISPGKTLEGAAGGLVSAVLVGVSLASTVGWSYTRGGGIALLVALAGLVGDLSASGWKRALGLKDFSRLLGPHGGMLDRFDALIFAAPVFFLLAVR